MQMTAAELYRLASVWANISRDMLVHAGVIDEGASGGSSWKRFNDDPIVFILKLPANRLEALAKLLSN